MNTEYNKAIQDLVESTEIKIEEIFNYLDFPDSPYFIYFEEVYNFYIETLNIFSQDYDIEPYYLFFSDNLSKNAEATRFENKYIIKFNRGTIDYIVKNYLEKEIEIVLNIRIELLNVTLPKLFYQLCLHSTIYHEIGHLIQKSPLLENGINENPTTENNEYSEERHLLELDADNFSALCLSQHIIDLYQNNFSDKKNINEFIELSAICCSVGLNYTLTFGKFEEPFYLKKTKHPHSIIRAFNIMSHITSYIQQYFDFENSIIKEITNRAYDFSQLIYGQSIIVNYRDTIKENLGDITDYINYFRDLDKNDESLSVYKWNQLSQE